MRKLITRTASALAGLALTVGLATAAAPAAQADTTTNGFWKCGPAFTYYLQDGTPVYFGWKCTWVDLSNLSPKPAAVKPATFTLAR